MKAKKTQNNEDEKVSIWDYVDKGTVIRVALSVVVLIFCIIGLLYLAGIIEPSPTPSPPEPHMHP